MPRGRKPVLESVETKLTQIDAEIETYKNKISSLQSEKKALLEKQKKMELEVLYKAVQESGKSIEDILDSLNKQ